MLCMFSIERRNQIFLRIAVFCCVTQNGGIVNLENYHYEAKPLLNPGLVEFRSPLRTQRINP